MVSQGLTEAALRRWNNENSTAIAKAPPGDSLRDPPGVVIGDHMDGWSARGSTTEESVNNSEDNLGEGDEEDDGLYIGAKEDDEDDSTIAFSDIELPTEENDPFLLELAEEAVQEAVDAVEMDVVVSSDKVLPNIPKPKPRPVVFSAHTIVAHNVARRKPDILQMSQQELLDQLEKRLRPYMKLPPKLPPLHKRKRPNCLFLNHMGTRKAPVIVKKRKVGVSNELQNTCNKKKKTMPTLPKQTEPVDPKTVTAPPSPTPCKAKINPVPCEPKISQVPEPVSSTPTLLPKLLTDSTWNEDLVDQHDDKSLETTFLTSPPFPSKTIDHAPVRTTETPSYTKKQVNKRTKVKKKKTPTEKELQVLRDIALVKAQSRAMVLTSEQPQRPPKKVEPVKTTKRTSYTKKKTTQADPPGTVGASEQKRRTSEASSKLSDTVDSACLEHDPLPPSFENSFHFHHDSLESFLADDSNQNNADEFQLPSTPDSDGKEPAERREKVMPAEVFMPMHDEILPSPRDETPPSTPGRNLRLISFGDPGEHNYGLPPPRPRAFGMHRPLLLSPEMDILSPPSHFGAQARLELAMDDHLSPASPTFHGHRKVVPVCPDTPNMPAYEATPDPHRLAMDTERMYYRRGPVNPYGDYEDEWATSSAHSSPTPYVTPDGLSSPGLRKKVREHSPRDWMMEGGLPCPPLAGGHNHRHPYHDLLHNRALSPVGCHYQESSTQAKVDSPTTPPEVSKKPQKKSSSATMRVSPSPVRSSSSTKEFDMKDFRKTISLRSGRKVASQSDKDCSPKIRRTVGNQ